MKRLDMLQEKCKQLPYNKLAKRLTEGEFDHLVTFIEDHEELGHLEFEYQVNRMFLDKAKPKNWAIIQELLVITNSAIHLKKRQ